MKIPGLKSLKQSTDWLRSRFTGGALILGYHRVAGVAADPYSMCVTPQHFAEQLEALRRHAHPISLQQLVLGLEAGNLPKRAVALTFDDGYADTLYQVKPLLAHYQIPVTVFVTTGYIGREFWWDELARILLSPATLPERLSLSINGGSYEGTSGESAQTTLKGGNPDPRQHLLLSLYQRLLLLASVKREKVMAQLWAWAEAGPDDQPRDRALTADEIIELATEDLVDVGAHTVTHPMLSALSLAIQRSEIQESKACLEQILGRPVSSFSYPNGSASKETLTIVRDAGFICACASFNNIARRASDRFYLPRFWIPNWDGAKFSRWLERWLRC